MNFDPRRLKIKIIQIMILWPPPQSPTPADQSYCRCLGLFCFKITLTWDMDYHLQVNQSQATWTKASRGLHWDHRRRTTTHPRLPWPLSGLEEGQTTCRRTPQNPSEEMEKDSRIQWAFYVFKLKYNVFKECLLHLILNTVWFYNTDYMCIVLWHAHGFFIH